MAKMLNARVPKCAAPDSWDSWETWTNQVQTDRSWVVEQALDHTLSIRNKTWKYIEPSDTKVKLMKEENVETGYSSEPQLYRVDKDVHENDNVATKYPDILFQLQAQLRKIAKGRVNNR